MPLGLETLNNPTPGVLSDVLRGPLPGPGMAFGDLLNAMIAKMNQSAVSTAAAATVTLGGAVHTGDTVTVVVGGNSVAYALTAGDTTLTLAATHLAAAINADPVMSKLVSAVGAAAVVTLTALRKGTGFNATTLTTAVTGGGATVTSTAQAATFGAATAGTGLDDILAIGASTVTPAI